MTTLNIPFDSPFYEPFLQFFLVQHGARPGTLLHFEHEKASKFFSKKQVRKQILEMAKTFGLLYKKTYAGDMVFFLDPQIGKIIDNEKGIGTALGFFCNTENDNWFDHTVTRLGINIDFHHPLQIEMTQV